MFLDGTEIYDWIKNRGYSRVIVIGYSFGCAASIGLANKRNVDGLVLISPFASLSRLVAEKYPFADWSLKDDYPSEQTIQKLTAPILIIHGTADTLVPVHHAEILYKQRSNNTSLHLLEGKDHREGFRPCRQHGFRRNDTEKADRSDRITVRPDIRIRRQRHSCRIYPGILRQLHNRQIKRQN